MFWAKMVKDFMRKKQKSAQKAALKSYARPKVIKHYHIGEQYPGIYLTQREAECVLQILKGKTATKASEEIGISPRTFEYYVKNTKTKLKCRTKYELIDIVQNSDFLLNVDKQRAEG